MNENKAGTSGGDAAVGTLEAKISRISRDIAEQQQRFARGSQRTAAIGGILCLAITAWFTFGYFWLGEFLEPKKLVAYIELKFKDEVPKRRKELEKMIIEKSPEWAAYVSQEIQNNMPAAREAAESFILQRTDDALEQLTVVTDAQFRSFVRENKPMLADGFKALRDEQQTNQLVADLQALAEKSWSGNMREQADDLLKTSVDLNNKLTKLSDGKGLDSEQALERQVLMLARRIETDSAMGVLEKPKKKKRAAAAGETEMTEDEAAATAKDGEKPAKASEPAVEKKEKAAEASTKPAEKKTKDQSEDKAAKPKAKKADVPQEPKPKDDN